MLWCQSISYAHHTDPVLLAENCIVAIVEKWCTDAEAAAVDVNKERQWWGIGGVGLGNEHAWAGERGVCGREGVGRKVRRVTAKAGQERGEGDVSANAELNDIELDGILKSREYGQTDGTERAVLVGRGDGSY